MCEAQKIFSKFGDSIGIENLSFDEENSCSLSFDDIEVTFEYSKDKELIYIYSIVSPVYKDENILRIYEFLLEQNSFYRGTEGGVFGVEPEMQVVTYTTLFFCYDSLEYSVSLFDDVVGKHLQTVETMQNHLVKLREEQPVSQDMSSLYSQKSIVWG